MNPVRRGHSGIFGKEWKYNESGFKRLTAVGFLYCLVARPDRERIAKEVKKWVRSQDPTLQ